jgi:hypothetical protein
LPRNQTNALQDYEKRLVPLNEAQGFQNQKFFKIGGSMFTADACLSFDQPEFKVLADAPASLIISQGFNRIRIFLEEEQLLALRDQITAMVEGTEAARELCVVKHAEAA